MLYIADRWQVSDATTAELGLRLDRYGYSDTPNERHASPRFSVRHALGSRTALRWSLGRYFQSQGLHELQVEDGVTGFHPAQRADQAVIGVERELGERYLLRAEVYHKSLSGCGRVSRIFRPARDLAGARARSRADRSRRSDSARARAVGRLRRARGLRWWASYVRARATDVVAGETVPRSWDQRDAAQLGVGHDRARLGARSRVQLSQRLADDGAHVEESPSGERTAIIGSRNAERLGGFASLDLRASRRVPLRVGALDVFVEVSNATNRDNPCCGDFDLEEDANGVFLEQETDTWLPRLATFGVLWQF